MRETLHPRETPMPLTNNYFHDVDEEIYLSEETVFFFQRSIDY